MCAKKKGLSGEFAMGKNFFNKQVEASALVSGPRVMRILFQLARARDRLRRSGNKRGSIIRAAVEFWTYFFEFTL